MEEWDCVWNGIYTSIAECGIIPIVHLVMHGNTTHIGIKKGEKGVVLHTQLFEKVRKANELSQNNIFFSMAVCEGLNVIRSLDIRQHMPFCGIIASEKVMINDETLDNYTIFYQSFFKTLDLNKAEAELRTNGVNTKDYVICKPEEVFMNSMAGYLQANSKANKIEERAEKLAKDGNIVLCSPEERNRFIQDVRALVAEEDAKAYKECLRTFFILDVYPDIADRFSVLKSLDEFKEWALQSGVNLY